MISNSSPIRSNRDGRNPSHLRACTTIRWWPDLRPRGSLPYARSAAGGVGDPLGGRGGGPLGEPGGGEGGGGAEWGWSTRSKYLGGNTMILDPHNTKNNNFQTELFSNGMVKRWPGEPLQSLSVECLYLLDGGRDGTHGCLPERTSTMSCRRASGAPTGGRGGRRGTGPTVDRANDPLGHSCTLYSWAPEPIPWRLEGGGVTGCQTLPHHHPVHHDHLIITPRDRGEGGLVAAELRRRDRLQRLVGTAVLSNQLPRLVSRCVRRVGGGVRGGRGGLHGRTAIQVRGGGSALQSGPIGGGARSWRTALRSNYSRWQRFQRQRGCGLDPLGGVQGASL